VHSRSHLCGAQIAVAEKACWGKTMAKGKGMGVAVHESFNTFAAEAAEIAVAQMEGGIGYALGAALREQDRAERGEVDQSNFNDYEPLASTRKGGGIGRR
jgi:isoquinoline 1-oxidoreductase beta subunit